MQVQIKLQIDVCFHFKMKQIIYLLQNLWKGVQTFIMIAINEFILNLHRVDQGGVTRGKLSHWLY